MDVSVPLSWLITSISLLSLLAGYALAAFRTGSASTRRAKQPPSPPTPPSELASLAADQAALFSTLEKLTTTVKRLSSRQGMRDLREREDQDQRATPPLGTSKADLLKFYGMSGKVGPAFAQAQLELEQGRPN